jgi:hypothetical protein
LNLEKPDLFLSFLFPSPNSANRSSSGGGFSILDGAFWVSSVAAFRFGSSLKETMSLHFSLVKVCK